MRRWSAADFIGLLAREWQFSRPNVWAHDQADQGRFAPTDTLQAWACTCGPRNGGTRTAGWGATWHSPRTGVIPRRAMSRPRGWTASAGAASSTGRACGGRYGAARRGLASLVL